MRLAATTGEPGALVRTGSMSVVSSSRFNAADWTPYYVRKGTAFFLGYKTPSTSTFRVSTDDGVNTTYYWRPSSSTSWNGAFSTRKFALKIHTRYADGENFSATGNASNSYSTDATFLHGIDANSDQWVSGFGFRCEVTSGTENVRFVLYRSGHDNKPVGSPIRSVTRQVTTTSQYVDVHFSPVLIARGERYFIGYETPSSGTLRPAASGANVYDTYYYWKKNSASSWNGPFNPAGFAFRVYKARLQANPYTDANASNSFVANSRFVWEIRQSENMWIHGFELFCDVASGSEVLNTYLYTSDSNGQPYALARTGKMTVTTFNDWRSTTFTTPYYVPAGTRVFVGVGTPSSQGLRFRASTSGSNPTYYWRDNTSSTWTGPVTTIPVGFKLHAHTGTLRLAYNGTPEIGQPLRIELQGASPNKIFGLVLGFSGSSWGPIPLPWDIPIFPGCTMYASYDLILAAGSTGATGNVSATLPIPNALGLLRASFYNQFWVIERSSPLEMSWSNGGRVTIGG
jgi:hypothetical protein